jgi:tetratricopeptide (TPR) repeat protein
MLVNDSTIAMAPTPKTMATPPIASSSLMTTPLIGTALADWTVLIDRALQEENPSQAVALAQVILRHLPRHLPTYQRLLRAVWMLKRWDEGEDWGQRMLRADPGNALAWRALAMAAEQRGQRAQAYAIWQRAFEANPYETEIRAGLSRTSLRPPDDGGQTDNARDNLMLNSACLATLYLRGFRWERAARLYRALIQADPRRIDFQVGLLAALWQQRATQETYRVARHLVQGHPYLLIAWVALDTIGDENDKALARNPIEMMDPDGNFVSEWFGLPYERRPATLLVNAREAELLGTRK